MGRKEIAHNRANKGTIPSKNYLNDRARNVERLIKTFRVKLGNNRPKIEDRCTYILKVGEAEQLFVCKDPYIVGVEIFVAFSRHFSDDNKCPVTYNEIRD